MSRHYSRSTDKNQAAILKDLRKMPGMRVANISRAGDGNPDILVKYGGRILLVEIKMPGKEQTDKEREFEEYWGSEDYMVYETAEQIFEWFGILTK